jgi:hypothetical protein
MRRGALLPTLLSSRTSEGEQRMSDDEDLNTGKDWSQMDIIDLQQGVALGNSVEEIAAFPMRSEREIREKAKELGLNLSDGS